MTDLDAAFAAHADEALAVANATFDAGAEVWLRECAWPGCLTAEQQLQLADEVGCELVGETHPTPAVYDQQATCRCANGHTESGR
jgi:hypothetical protein